MADFPVSLYFFLHSVFYRILLNHPPIRAGPTDEATVADAPLREVYGNCGPRTTRA